MPVMIVAVIDDSGKVWDVLDAWEKQGVSNATIVDSTGLHQARGLRDDLPLFPSVHDLLGDTESHHSTIWAVVEDRVDIEEVVRVTQEIIGSLDQPHAGILFTMPVLKVWGLRSSTGQ